MALHIARKEVDDKVAKLADRLGKSKTAVVEDALDRFLEQTEAVPGNLRAAAQRCAALPDKDNRSPEEILGYDEVGLPR